ncbi:MAG: YdcF family protein [Deltaproteobacteria bacterium]|nr:YdcF family protein [Deltaproteobacteria bacterium]
MKISKTRSGKSLFMTVLRTLLLFILLIIAVYLFRVQLLTGLASFLVVDDNPQKGDVIFVLNGDVDTRPFFAAKIFREGRTPRIVIARCEDTPAVKAGIFPNDTDAAVGIMKKLGVPENKISVLSIPGGVTSTRDEAAVLRRYVDAHGIRRVILVTSAFHTRRAMWIMRKELAGSPATVLSAPAPHNKFDTASWWKVESGLIHFADEYIKLLYYRVKYR